MTLLYLVRHGETDWNRARRIQGSTNIALNDHGREQAVSTGKLLARRSWDAIYASPLSRAFETASIISAEVGLGEPIVVDTIVERNYGAAEGLTGDEMDRMFPAGAEVPGRESRDDVATRALAALHALAATHPGGALIVVSHGGLIRTVLYAIGRSPITDPIRNGSVHSFRHADGGLELIAFDDPIEHESLDPAADELEAQNAIEGRESVELGN